MLSRAFVTHVVPQSYGATPIPRMPLAPSAAGVFSSEPLAQPVGTLLVKSPSTWTGMLLVVVSPPTVTVAVRTEPHEKPSAKFVHSASSPPDAAVTGSAPCIVEVNTPLAIRSPYEPVSTCTSAMVWQVL